MLVTYGTTFQDIVVGVDSNGSYRYGAQSSSMIQILGVSMQQSPRIARFPSNRNPSTYIDRETPQLVYQVRWSLVVMKITFSIC